MKTYPECYPCFLNLAMRSARMAVDDEDITTLAVKRAAGMIPDFNPDNTPAAGGSVIYSEVLKITENKDPYKKIKEQHIKEALEILPDLEKMVKESSDPLLTAVKIAIAGNVIDLGITEKVNISENVNKLLQQDFGIFHYEEFKKTLEKASFVLYLGDNSGESVFDTVLIKALNKKVVYVVRENPVINDVTYKEAVMSGIDKVAEIVSSGTSAAGTILELCSNEFIELFNKAPMIISKGQGNYEGLSLEKKPLFFLLKAKCIPIAKDIGVNVGDIILKSAMRES